MSEPTARAHLNGQIITPHLRTVVQLSGAVGYEVRLRYTGKCVAIRWTRT